MIALQDAQADGPNARPVITVPAGTHVDLGGGWFAIIAPEALVCDCGKAIYCPWNAQYKIPTQLEKTINEALEIIAAAR